MSTTSTTLSTGVFSGIFAYEPGQRLLQILLKLADQAFRALYDKCAPNLSGQYYQAGLKRVRNWSNDVINEDIECVRSECTDMETTYKMCFQKYVEHWFQTNRVQIKIPALFDFVRRFVEALGEHVALTSGEFFISKDVVYARMACMDACRTAMSAMMTPENVRLLDTDSVVNVSTSADDDVIVGPDDSISQVGGSQVLTSVESARSRYIPAEPSHNMPTTQVNVRSSSPPARSVASSAAVSRRSDGPSRRSGGGGGGIGIGDDISNSEAAQHRDARSDVSVSQRSVLGKEEGVYDTKNDRTPHSRTPAYEEVEQYNYDDGDGDDGDGDGDDGRQVQVSAKKEGDQRTERSMQRHVDVHHSVPEKRREKEEYSREREQRERERLEREREEEEERERKEWERERDEKQKRRELERQRLKEEEEERERVMKREIERREIERRKRQEKEEEEQRKAEVQRQRESEKERLRRSREKEDERSAVQVLPIEREVHKQKEVLRDERGATSQRDKRISQERDAGHTHTLHEKKVSEAYIGTSASSNVGSAVSRVSKTPDGRLRVLSRDSTVTLGLPSIPSPK